MGATSTVRRLAVALAVLLALSLMATTATLHSTTPSGVLDIELGFGEELPVLVHSADNPDARGLYQVLGALG